MQGCVGPGKVEDGNICDHCEDTNQGVAQDSSLL
jgi:hypothetical protein